MAVEWRCLGGLAVGKGPIDTPGSEREINCGEAFSLAHGEECPLRVPPYGYKKTPIANRQRIVRLGREGSKRLCHVYILATRKGRMPCRIRARLLTSVWVQFAQWLFNVTSPP